MSKRKPPWVARKPLVGLGFNQKSSKAATPAPVYNPVQR
jgi:hypothetical protein